jgi:hypothetical protein
MAFESKMVRGMPGSKKRAGEDRKSKQKLIRYPKRKTAIWRPVPV